MVPFTERTLVLLKPDAVQRGLVGEILRRFEAAGLAIIALKMVHPTRDKARGHYPVTEVQLRQMGGKTLETYQNLGIDPEKQLGTSDPLAIGKMIHEWNSEFLSSGPIVAGVLEGVHAVKKVRTLAGKTMPIDAAPGTIRGDFASVSPALSNLLKSSVHNLIHASDNENDPAEPLNEIRYWFSDDEICPNMPVAVRALYKQT
jgi:nucleoside-diphosphate kinase